MWDAESTTGGVLLILRSLAAAAAVVVALSGALPASAAPKATSAPTDGLAYVALGDSYAAGFGLSDPTGKPVSACSQSARDYPHRVAALLGLELTDVSCAGATTANIVDARQSGAAPQADSLGAQTKVVTVSIGGNDADLFGTASTCIALGADGPVFGAKSSGRSCSQTLKAHKHDTLADAIDTTVARGLRSAFATIAAKAPQARVFVVGYPAIFPDAAHTPAGGCFRPVVDGSTIADGFPANGFPFTDTDVAYLASVQARLDRVTRKATERAGFHYVSTLSASEAHSGCSTDSPYITGISLTASAGFRSISLRPGALHPNERGTAFLADRAAAAIRSSFEAETPAAGPAVVELLWPVLGGALVAGVVILLLARRRRSR